ncbi:MAG: 16S rRNA (adenine(1518)-N(6)/adenine(1519)-N(6))-dimethyltransferase RsmA [Patescibacteria group bacterium]
MPFAKKSLGQNFLISPRVVGAIVAAGNLKEREIVLEIGPGKGTLTRALLEAGAHVRAIEKDDRLIPILAKVFEKEIANGKLELIHGDVMALGDGIFSREWGGSDSYKVIANIPYYITGALIRNFLSAKIKPSLMVLMVQKEVAERIIARDGKESILSLSVKVYATPELVMNVSRGNFFPIPNVDSAVIKLSNIRNPFSDENGAPDENHKIGKIAEQRFFEIIKAGFAQKRKKLISNLEKVMPAMSGEMPKEKLKILFEKLGLDENIRAEDIPLKMWLKLSSQN